jgi:hypothetical protein
MSERLFSSYYICRGMKPSIAAVPSDDRTEALNDNVDLDVAHRIAAE